MWKKDVCSRHIRVVTKKKDFIRFNNCYCFILLFQMISHLSCERDDLLQDKEVSLHSI